MTSTILNIIRNSIDISRSICGQVGLRPYQCNLIQLVYANPNLYGTPNKINTKLGHLDFFGNIQNPYVEEVFCGEILASGGKYDQANIMVGPFTKNYLTSVSGGYLLANLNPLVLSHQITTGTLSFSTPYCTYTSSNIITNTLLVGQSIQITNATHSSNNGNFVISSINTTNNSVQYVNINGQSDTCSAEIWGSLSMHIELTNLDDSKVDRCLIKAMHEYEINSITIECRKVDGS